MNEQEREDVKAALESQHDQMKVRFHLRRALGLETMYEEINGHLYREGDDCCRAMGCEMFYKEHAHKHECPTNYEAVDRYDNPDGW